MFHIALLLFNNLVYGPVKMAVRQTTIVDPIEILPPEVIRNENWLITSLHDKLSTLDITVKWLACRRLLKNSFRCLQCHEDCTIINDQQRADGKKWRCCQCHGTKSIRDGSFFSGSKLSLKKIVMLIYCWTHDFPQNISAIECEISEGHTLIDWFNFCREECQIYMSRDILKKSAV